LIDFAPAGITDEAAAPERHALLVGIDAFEDERFPDLRYAAADARAMGRALEPAFDQIRVLTTPAETRRAAVLEALAEIGQRDLGPRDTLLLYFSTHGSLGRRPGGRLERFLVTADTRMNLLAQTGLSVEKLQDVVAAMPARRKLLVLAACHSGKGKSQIADELAAALAALKSGPPAPLEEVSEATIVLTASAFGDTARESEKLGHDIYTHFFLEALGGGRGDRDGDGAVTASEAHDYARGRTYAFTSGLQRPTAESEILGRDPIVLAGRRRRLGLPVLFSHAASAAGLEVRIGGRVKGVLPGGVAVPAGEHELTLADAHSGETLYSGPIAVERGQVVELSALLPEPPGWSLTAGGLFDWPLLAPERGEYLPPSFGARLGTRLNRWPAAAWVLGLDLAYRGGRGQAGGFDEKLPYAFHALGLSASVGYRLELGDSVSFSPALAMGPRWARREFDRRDFRKTESWLGFGLALELRLTWKLSESLGLLAQLSASGLLAELGGDPGPHPSLGLSLGASFGL
jgi:hypothetical protein